MKIFFLPETQVALKLLVAVLPVRKSSKEIASCFPLLSVLFFEVINTTTAAMMAAITSMATTPPSINTFRFFHVLLFIINPYDKIEKH